MVLTWLHIVNLKPLRNLVSDLDAATQAKLNRGRRTIEALKQPLHLAVEKQVVILYALTHGFLDSVPVHIKSWILKKHSLTFFDSHLS